MPEPAEDAPARLAALDRDPGRLLAVLERIPGVLALLRGPEHLVELVNPRFEALAGPKPVLGRPLADVLHHPAGLTNVLDCVVATGEAAVEPGWRGELDGDGHPYEVACVPVRSPEGTVEGVLMHGIDVSALVGAERAAQENDARFRALVGANVIGVCIADAEQILEANDTVLQLMGRSRDDVRAGAIRWRELTPPEWSPADDRALAELAMDGRAAPYEKELVRPDGTRVPVLVGGATLSQEPLRIIAFFLDLTERRAAERERELLLTREREARREAELAAGRIARLQRITAALSAAISAEDVAELIVNAAVEALGATAGVVVLRDGDELELRRSVGYEQEAIGGWARFPLDAPVPLADCIRSREPVLLEGPEDWESHYPEGAKTLRRYEALAAVPFVFHGEALGAMGISLAEAHRFTSADRTFLLALARQCGQALERARLYEERAYVARTLQDGLLPDRLADVPGLDVAVRYRSISDGGAVGGDFYDLFDVAESRWLVAIGDVCGKGTAAAVLTGLARHTIRAIAMREEAPDEVLNFLNEAMRRQVGDSSYCTVGCATITARGDGGFTACLASGGHAYPLLIRPGHPVREIEVPGTLLGFLPGLRLDAVSLELEPGDVLVYYTDGIIDARDEEDRFGEHRLVATLEQERAGTADEIADAVDDAVRRHQPGAPRDDRAILVLCVTG